MNSKGVNSSGLHVFLQSSSGTEKAEEFDFIKIVLVSFIFPAVVFHFPPQYTFKLITGLLSDDSCVLFSIGTEYTNEI